MNNLFKKIIILLLSILCLVGVYFLSEKLDKDYIFSIEIINRERLDEIIENKTEISFDDVELKFNNDNIAKLNNNDYYIIERNDEEYEGTLSIKDNKYNLLLLSPSKSKLDLIKNGEPLKLLIYNNESYEIRDIYMTYIPIIEINDSKYLEYRDNGKDLYSGNINLYEYINDSTYQREAYYTLYHVRGNSTANNYKKSYSIDLRDDNLEPLKTSLLGLRADDDYNLLSMGTDASYMKEKLSMEIWKELSDYSVGSKYVEVIKDGEYIGLYLLSEPVDIKTFGGSKKDGDIYVKVHNWYEKDYYGEAESSDVFCLKEDKCILDEITYKNVTTDERDEMARISRAFRSLYDGSDTDLFEFDYENCVDYSLFLNLVMGTDNTYKNERMLLVKNGDEYKLYKSAWDFDYNFKYSYVAKLFEDKILPTEYKNSDEYKKDVARLYESLSNFYNIDNLLSILEDYNEYISNSGVLTRIVENNSYLGSNNYLESYITLRSTIKNRVRYLDYYYNNLLQED